MAKIAPLSPIEKIRRGIDKRDWKLVADGYGTMTGTPLDLVDEPEVQVSISKVDVENLLKDLVTSVQESTQHLLEEFFPGFGEEVEEVTAPVIAKPKQKKGQTKNVTKSFIKVAQPEYTNEVHDPDAKFRVPPSKKLPEERREARRVDPSEEEPHHNTYVDDGTDAVEFLEETIYSNKKRNEKPHREKRDELQFIEVVCDRCNKRQSVHPDCRPRKLDKDDETTKYICDRCLKRG